MPCNPGRLANGTSVIICGDAVMPGCRAPGCNSFADYLCDYPMGEGRTCDLPVCGKHRRQVTVAIGEVVDLCVHHRTLDTARGGEAG